MIISWNQPGAVDVSACIVNWNGCDVLARLLESLERDNSTASVEAIVVDNASTDGSMAMMGARFPWARAILNPENSGFSRANNQAAAAARGRRLFFLNNDTAVHPGAIDALSHYLDEHPRTSAVGPRTLREDGSHYPSCRRLPTWPVLLTRLHALGWTNRFTGVNRRYLMHDMDRRATQPVEQMDGAALMIPRGAFDAAGGWDEGFTFGLEDVDLCARLARQGPLTYLPQATITHRVGVASSSNMAYRNRCFEFGYARYLAKHGRTRLAAPLYKLVVTVDQLLRPLAFIAFAIKWLDYKRRGRTDLIAQRRDALRQVFTFWPHLPRYWFITGPRPAGARSAGPAAAGRTMGNPP
jgi:GT2 family glycosyltransferase